MPMDDDDLPNAWTKAFSEASKSDLEGKEKTNLFKKIYGQKKQMAGSDEPVRSNTGKYDEDTYHPTRKKIIQTIRDLGLTSPADRAKVAAMKEAAGNMESTQNPNIIPIPTPMGENKPSSNDYKSNYNDIDWSKVKGDKKGGLVRGHGKVMKDRIKYTKKY